MSEIDTDQPKSKRDEDRFQRYDFSRRIAGIIASETRLKSLVIGLYGKWGEGKTSVMNFIKTELPADVVVVNFNPWLFNSEEQLMRSFFSSLAYELDQSLATGKEKVGKLLSDYGEAIGIVTNLFGVSLDGVKGIGDKMQEASIEKLKTRVDEMISSTGKKIVVCVDDIDRLDVREIQYIFKLIKLVGDFPGTTYVLAFDDEMVAGALAPQYGDKSIGNGYTFLEKIIQLPLKIPKATRPALKKYVLEMLDQVIRELKVELNQDEVNKFRATFDEFYIPHVNNPRLASRLANAVYFALPLLYGEVNTTDLVLMEGMKVLFPAAYDFTRSNSDLLLTDTTGMRNRRLGKEKDKAQIVKEVDIFLQTLPKDHALAIKEIWKQLFPQYRFAVGNIAYRDDKWRDWYRQKRICSGAYFERYFTYVVKEGDIADIQFQQLLDDLEQLEVEDCIDKFSELLAGSAISDMVFKLRLWEESLSTRQSENLSLLLAKRGSDFPIEEREFASFTTHAEAAKIIAKLTKNLPEDRRKAHLVQLFQSINDLEFSLEIFYWVLYRKKDSQENTIADSEVSALEELLLSMFRSHVTQENFFEILPDAETWRILTWWKASDPSGLQDAIENAVSGSVESVIKLIKVFTPTINSWGGKGSRTFKSGFDADNYKSMSETINVEFAYQILSKSGTDRKPFDLKAIPNRDPLDDSDLISIFMLFYESGFTVSETGSQSE
jgi:hypothetical protein